MFSIYYDDHDHTWWVKAPNGDTIPIGFDTEEEAERYAERMNAHLYRVVK